RKNFSVVYSRIFRVYASSFGCAARVGGGSSSPRARSTSAAQAVVPMRFHRASIGRPPPRSPGTLSCSRPSLFRVLDNSIPSPAPGRADPGDPGMHPLSLAFFLLLALAVPAAIGAGDRPRPRQRNGAAIRWKKTVVDRDFRSEGVAVADINRDGKPDILAGNLWYEAPGWIPHEIAPAQKFDGATGYSNSFINFAMDV